MPFHLKGPDPIVLGMASIDIVKANPEILRSFKPLPRQRMEELAHDLTPFYNPENLPWMNRVIVTETGPGIFFNELNINK